MKKFMIAFVMVGVLSYVAAQSVTLGVEYRTDLGLTAQYAHPVEFGDLLFGVRVVPVGYDTELSTGVLVPMFVVEEETVVEFSLPVLLHLPVSWKEGSLILGQVAASVGVDVHIPNDNGFGLAFGVSARSPVNATALSEWPTLAFSTGLRYSF